MTNPPNNENHRPAPEIKKLFQNSNKIQKSRQFDVEWDGNQKLFSWRGCTLLSRNLVPGCSWISTKNIS